MKTFLRLLVLMLCLSSVNQFQAQTLQPGDIAFTVMNRDSYTDTGTGTTGDSFAFVALVDIPSGTQINFTNRGWDGSKFLVNTEESVQLTLYTTLSAGSQVMVFTNNGGGNLVKAVFSGTATSVGNVVFTYGTSFSFGGSGDQIIAYQGTSSFIAGLHAYDDQNDAGGTQDNSTKWSASGFGSASTISSMLPPGLTNGSTANSLFPDGNSEQDNARYAGPLYSGTKAALLAAINDVNNWQFNSSTPYSTPSGSFTVASACSMTASITSQTNVACFDESTGSLTVTASDGSANYNYVWTKDSSLYSNTLGTSSTTNTISGLSSGTYSVTITDGNSCTATASATITQPGSAIVAATTLDQAVSCNGGSDGEATASASGGTPGGGYTYSWSGGSYGSDFASTASISGVPAGTYTVVVTDANGCSDSEVVTITQPSILSVNAQVDYNVSCNGGVDGGASASPSGGVGGYTYLWSTGQTTSQMGYYENYPDQYYDPSDPNHNTVYWEPTPAGTYTVTVTDANGCTATGSVTITEPPVLTASASVVSDTPTGISQGSATATGSGGSPGYSYDWRDSSDVQVSTLQTATGLAAGTYTVLVSDANSCDASIQSVTINTITLQTIPYLEDFESGANGWTSGGTLSTWELGTPADNTINSAASGTNAWMTNLTGDYNTNENSYLVSPLMDFSSTTTDPIVRMSIWWETENMWDGAILQSSIDNGASWQLVGDIGTGTNWYNNTFNGNSPGNYNKGWTGNNGTNSSNAWVTAENTLVGLAGESAVRIRILFNSDGVQNDDGIAIDNFYVGIPCDLSVSVSKCYDGNSGNLTAQVSGGTGNFDYVWSQGSITTDTSDTSNSITGLVTGTYSITVTDAAGCSAESTVTLSAADLITYDLHSEDLSCAANNNGSVRASAVIFLQDFEDGSDIFEPGDGEASISLSDVSGIQGLDFQTTTGGRLNFRPDFQRPNAGKRIASLDNPGGGGLNQLTQEIDLSAYVGETDLKLDFWWYDHGDEGDAQDIVEVRGSSSDPWIEIYDFGETFSSGAWFYASFDIDQILSDNGQSFSSTFAIRFNQTDNFPIATDGISIDDLAVFRENTVYSFSWSNGVTSSTQAAAGSFYSSRIDNLEEGTYTLDITSDTGCTVSTSVTIANGDTEAPTITCPADIVTNNDSGSIDAVVNYVLPTFTDNCTGASIEQTAGLASGSTFPLGVTTNTFVVTDSAGNTNTCSFTVTVEVDGYVYVNNTWIPMQPEGNALVTDNLYVFNGTTNLTADLEVNNVEVMSGANLDIENILKVNGDFENNGTVTFKSTATQDGELDEFTGNITGTGSFVVERFNIDQRSYRMLTSSVNSNESIHTNWQEGADSSTDNPNPGFGTHITGSTIDQQNGFDGTATGNASMYLINSATQGFEAVANTDNTNLVAGQPYFMYIRGDRSIDLTATTANQGSTSTILRATGMLVTGNQQQQFTINNDGDYLMFGNPYQSAIDMSSVIANSNNVNGAFYYVYDPNVGEFGGYVTYDFSLGSTVPTSQADQYLQPGQGAQIAGNTAGTVTLNFAEADKAPGNHSNTSKMNTNFAGIKAGLYTTDNFQNGAYAHDGFVVSFDGSNQITQEDATKPMNLGENLGISKEGKTLSIEKREMPQATDVIQLFTNNYNSQEYTLTLKVTGLTGVTAYFNDSYTGTSTQLNEGMNSLSILVDQGIEASIAENRFHISFDSESLSTKEESYFSLSLYPNPTRDGNFSITSTELSDQAVILTVTDLLGREVIKKQVKFNGNNLNIDANEKLTSGVYLINITQGSRTQTVKLIKE